LGIRVTLNELRLVVYEDFCSFSISAEASPNQSQHVIIERGVKINQVGSQGWQIIRDPGVLAWINFTSGLFGGFKKHDEVV
jgi:hypothetical protein